MCRRSAGGTPNASSSTTASAAIGGDNSTGSGASNGHTISFDCHMWRMRREEGQKGRPVPQKPDSMCTVMYYSVSAPWAVGRNSATRRGSGSAIGFCLAIVIHAAAYPPEDVLNVGGWLHCGLIPQPRWRRAQWRPRRAAQRPRPHGPRAPRGTRRRRRAPRWRWWRAGVGGWVREAVARAIGVGTRPSMLRVGRWSSTLTAEPVPVSLRAGPQISALRADPMQASLRALATASIDIEGGPAARREGDGKGAG